MKKEKETIEEIEEDPYSNDDFQVDSPK